MTVALKSELPDRTRFIRLPPIGLGTPECESLASYALRLALAHDIRPARLYSLPWSTGSRHDVRFVSAFPAINPRDGSITTSPHGQRLARMLAEATGIPELSALNWHHDQNQVSLARLLIPSAKWCATCLRDRPEGYHRIIWEFSGIDVCHEHGCRLTHACPHCGRRVAVFSDWTTHRCRACGWDLADAASVKALTDEREFCRDLGRIVAELTHGSLLLQRASPGKTLLQWANDCKATSLSRQSTLLGVSKATIFKWERSGQPVALARILEICQAHGLCLAELLHGHATKFLHPDTTRPTCWGGRSLISEKRIAELNRRVLALANGAACPSFREAARLLDVDRKTLRRYAGGECARLIEKHRRFRQKLARGQWLAFTAHTTLILAGLRQKRLPCTFRAVGAAFVKPGILRNPARRAFVKSVL